MDGEENTTAEAEAPTETTIENRANSAATAWLEHKAAQEAETEKDPEPDVQPEPEAKDSEPDADAAPEPAPKGDGEPSDLARSLAGEDVPDAPGDAEAIGGWTPERAEVLQRARMRPGEIEKLGKLAEENPWMGGWLDALGRSQSKTDEVIADLKARNAGLDDQRAPTPNEDRGDGQTPVRSGVDQPGSEDRISLTQLAESLSEELGDEKTELLNRYLRNQEADHASLRAELDGFTRSAQLAETTRRIDGMVAGARSQLAEEFPGLADEARFKNISATLKRSRPNLDPESITAAMRTAAKAEFFDDMQESVKGLKARTDSKRRDRKNTTAPTTGPNAEGATLSPQEIAFHGMKMRSTGKTIEEVRQWTQAQYQRSRKAASTVR